MRIIHDVVTIEYESCELRLSVMSFVLELALKAPEAVDLLANVPRTQRLL